jgi:hypothetical protein
MRSHCRHARSRRRSRRQQERHALPSSTHQLPQPLRHAPRLGVVVRHRVLLPLAVAQEPLDAARAHTVAGSAVKTEHGHSAHAAAAHSELRQRHAIAKRAHAVVHEPLRLLPRAGGAACECRGRRCRATHTGHTAAAAPCRVRLRLLVAGHLHPAPRQLRAAATPSRAGRAQPAESGVERTSAGGLRRSVLSVASTAAQPAPRRRVQKAAGRGTRGAAQARRAPQRMPECARFTSSSSGLGAPLARGSACCAHAAVHSSTQTTAEAHAHARERAGAIACSPHCAAESAKPPPTLVRSAAQLRSGGATRGWHSRAPLEGLRRRGRECHVT